jgi:hypothetical protein
MSIKCSAQVVLRGLTVASLACGIVSLASPFAAGQAPAGQTTRMATFDHAGDTFFALSLVPDATTAQQRAADVVVYVDTSASQVGEYKRGSINSLKQFLKTLNADDRVKICAVDLDPVPLTDGFVDPSGKEVQLALRSLDQRTPLGSTDYDLMLESAANEFQNNEGKNQCVVYIGDGVSRTGTAEILVERIKALVKKQITVSGYLLGANRDATIFATLANHTGGNVFIQNDEDGQSADQGALFLGQTVHNPVFWPQNSELDKNLVTVYPSQIPPLRSDRDSILVGTIANRDAVSLKLAGVVNGNVSSLEFQVQPEPSNVEFAFLPALLKRARNDQGATLPTLGSAGLREIKALLKTDAEQLAALGSQALINGDKDSARTLAAAAIETNPADPRNGVLAMSSTYRVQDQEGDDPFGAGEDDPFGTGEQSQGDSVGEQTADESVGQDSDSVSDASTSNSLLDSDKPLQDGAVSENQDELVQPEVHTAPAIPPSEPLGAAQSDLPPSQDDPGRMTLIGPEADQGEQLLQEQYLRGQDNILSEESRRQIANERARKQVEFEQKRAREEMLTNPDAAIERIKSTIEILDQTSDLYPATRQDLRYSLESALLSFRQRKLEFDDRRAREIELKSVADNQRLRSVRLLREEEELGQLISRFNSLMQERNYDAAISVTETALEKAPNNPHIIAAAEAARVTRNVTRMQELRALKANKFYEALYLAEVATVPFPDTQWLVYPDPEVWRQKVIRRRKWQDIRLAGSPIDESILRTLEEPVDLDYEEVEWSAVQRDLFDRFKINIATDQTALDDALPQEELITFKRSGISLKYALRQMLKEKNATYIVKDEVLLVISLDNVEDPQFLVTNVYNVGDLVAPRRPTGGGMMGGMMGGMGGMGMGGMGMGGMGGGMGMGGMGGGMGGMFCVQEDAGLLQLGNVVTSNPNSTESVHRSPKKPQRIQVEIGADAANAWNLFFSSNPSVDDADVRETVRQLMVEKKADEVVGLISAAIRHDQLQPWMYEAISLAMQIAGRPKSEIERAVMSAIDFSDDPADLLFAAQFLATNGMEHRAIRLLKDIAAKDPANPEPFVLGLRAAQKANDLAGIKWATIGVFSQEWPDYPEIVREAKIAADAVRMGLKKQGLTDELEAFENDLLDAQVRDCLVQVSWTGDADIDIYVAEPSGTTCSRLAPRTVAGGIYFGDKFSAKSGQSGQMTETYVLPKGFSGNYQLLVRRLWGEATSNKVTVSIFQHYRSPSEGSLTKQVALDDIGAVVLFSLANGRRTDSLEDHAIRTIVQQQMAKNRFFFAQQVRQGTGSSGGSGSGNGSGSGGGNGNGGGGNPNGNPGGFPNGNLWGGVVGYQPIIQTIPEGTMLQVNHATTADRLHVVVSLTPNFPQVSSVSTFNIFGTADTAAGIAGGGTGGGLGGGVGGGGGIGGGGGVF